ncbi:hypothetical protein [Saccharothrix hoggarensis]|uniref:Uncharacterized protein n=1 Tax=Saccharothrix hoggarensis TaxID=913853 RepID=A0ABW3QFR8_9PSEU
MALKPKIDKGIPELVNIDGLARLTGVPRDELNMRYLSGLIPGADVEGRGVVFRPAIAKDVMANPRPSRAVRDEKIPDLVSSEVAAGLRGISRQRLDVLYREGRIPARLVTDRLLLFRRSVAEGGQVGERTGEPCDDSSFPELVDRTGAGEILGVTVKTLERRYHAGQLPGATYETSNPDRPGLVFRLSVVQEAVGREFVAQPVRDPKIPDLLSSGEAGKILGGNRETARNRYLHGYLAGRPVEGTEGKPQRLVFRPEVVAEHAEWWKTRPGGSTRRRA